MNPLKTITQIVTLVVSEAIHSNIQGIVFLRKGFWEYWSMKSIESEGYLCR